MAATIPKNTPVHRTARQMVRDHTNFSFLTKKVERSAKVPGLLRLLPIFSAAQDFYLIYFMTKQGIMSLKTRSHKKKYAQQAVYSTESGVCPVAPILLTDGFLSTRVFTYSGVPPHEQTDDLVVCLVYPQSIPSTHTYVATFFTQNLLVLWPPRSSCSCRLHLFRQTEIVAEKVK